MTERQAYTMRYYIDSIIIIHDNRHLVFDEEDLGLD